MREERDFMMKKRDKMARMKGDYGNFLGLLQERKRQIYDDKMAAWQKLYQEQKKKRLDERRKMREEDRRDNFERQRLAEEKERLLEAERIREALLLLTAYFSPKFNLIFAFRD
jgi:hypothetical protein